MKKKTKNIDFHVLPVWVLHAVSKKIKEKNNFDLNISFNGESGLLKTKEYLIKKISMYLKLKILSKTELNSLITGVLNAR